MLRSCFPLLGLVAAIMLSTGGCRSCSTCHDYSAPVANCDCNACGTYRAGSASAPYDGTTHVEGEYTESDAEAVEQPLDAPSQQQPAEEY